MSEYADIVWCAWCVADSGRTNATAPCCIARRMSKMVPTSRMSALSDVERSQGAQVGAELRAAVLRSIAMRAAKMVKDARLALYQRMKRDGWMPADLDAVKVMAKEEYEKGLAHG